MENKFTNEQIEKAKECKSVEEIIALAKENGTDLTEAEATNIFAQFNPANGELSDEELNSVAGGCDNEGNYINITKESVPVGTQIKIKTFSREFFDCKLCGNTIFTVTGYREKYVCVRCTKCNKETEAPYTTVVII